MKAGKKTKLGLWQKRAREGGVCEECKTWVKHLTVDHVIPISIVLALDKTGSLIYEDEENFRLICPVCNHFKANKLDIKNPKTKPLLIKYINLI